MIGKLQGEFSEVSVEGAVIINVGGVGYSVRVPLTTLEELRNKKHATVPLFIHTAVREDAIDLYGFKTPEELSFFGQLMQVKGVGPKTALGILNLADVQVLRKNIARGDASALTRVFGIGKRTAERIVVELKDKLANAVRGGGGGDDSEVIEALMALGYRAEEARRALGTVAEEVVGVHNRLTHALRQLGQKK